MKHEFFTGASSSRLRRRLGCFGWVSLAGFAVLGCRAESPSSQEESSLTTSAPSAGTGAGVHVLRLTASDRDLSAFDEVQVAAEAQTPTDSLSNVTPNPAVLGSAVSVTWGAPADHSVTDWVGLYQAGAEDASYLAWKYVGSAGLSAGTLSFTMPSGPAGSYEFRYFLNDGTQKTATVAFEGQEGTGAAQSIGRRFGGNHFEGCDVGSEPDACGSSHDGGCGHGLRCICRTAWLPSTVDRYEPAARQAEANDDIDSEKSISLLS